MFVLIAAALGALLIFYIFVGRTLLRRVPVFDRFFDWIEPMEIVLWRKSRTILWSRFLIVVGILPVVLEQLQNLNVPGLSNLLPTQYQAWWSVSFSIIGVVNEMLRRDTTRPLALVALPDDVSPKVAAAVEAAEVSQDKAVAAAAETAK